jgi:ankyrin repeat protein
MDKLLIKAAKAGDLSLVKFALKFGKSDFSKERPFEFVYAKEKALREASRGGYLEILKYLVDKGADIHTNYDAALRFASSKGHLEIVKYLIEKGLDPHVGDDAALEEAMEGKHWDVVKYLQSLP